MPENLVTKLTSLINTPEDLLIASMAFFVVVASVAILIKEIVKAITSISHAIFDTMFNKLLEFWKSLIQEIKGEKNLAGYINAYGSLSFVIATFVVIVCEVSPSIAKRLGGDASSKMAFPVASLTFFIFTIALILFSIYLIGLYENKKSIQDKLLNSMNSDEDN